MHTLPQKSLSEPMSQPACTEVRAECEVTAGHIQVVQHRFASRATERVLRARRFRLEFCLTPQHRGARGNFRSLWSSDRYEPVGSMFMAPPDTELRIRSDEMSPITCVVCELNSEAIMRWFDARPEPTDRLLCASLDIRNLSVKQLLLRASDELQQPGFASQVVVDALATQLVIQLFRHGLSVSEPRPHGGLAPWQLHAIDKRLRQAGQAPTLASLAQLCRISVRQLTRSFRASRGCSLGAFVAERQLELAKELLTTGESVAMTASRLGFASSSNFCIAFRRTMGMSPGAFRRRLGT
jgi:AraC family transcriptional regulator